MTVLIQPDASPISPDAVSSLRPAQGGPSRAESRTSERAQATIPLLPTALIGRGRAIATARQLLLLDGARLLTLTGPPGVGKTSLALALAMGLREHFGRGVALVDLSTVVDPDLVAATIAERLRARGSADRRPSERVIKTIRDREFLLVLDNFEQVIGAAPLVAELLSACSRLVILVTSRIPLRLRWEHELPISPLAVPDADGAASPDILAGVPSVALFLDRAQAVNPGFRLTAEHAPAIADICRRLDGLPLAIELAAAWTRLLPPDEIARQLTAGEDAHGHASESAAWADRVPLDILADGSRDLPPRQQSLRAAIEWSHALLSEPEQILFRRLAIFVGGSTIGAINGVASHELRGTSGLTASSPLTTRYSMLDLVGALVEKGLLRREETAGAGPRLRMLETIREYARERLAASEDGATIQERHTAFYLALAERAAPELDGPDQRAWLLRLDSEHDNLRAVARRATAHRDAETVVRLGAALWRFWWLRGNAEDAHERVQAILNLSATMPPSPGRLQALRGAGILARELGEYARARALLQESLTVAHQLGDRRAASTSLVSLGWLALQQGAHVEARSLLEASLDLARQIGDRSGTAEILGRLGYVAFAQDDRAVACTHYEQSLQIAHAIDDRRVLGEVLFFRALCHHADGELAQAQALYAQSRSILHGLRHRHELAQTLLPMGLLAAMQGDGAAARSLYREALSTAREAGNRRRQAFALWLVAGLATTEGEAGLAVRLDTIANIETEAMGAVLARPVRRLFTDQVLPAYQTLDANGVEAARQSGRSTTLDQAVDEALGWLGAGAQGVDTVGPAKSASARVAEPPTNRLDRFDAGRSDPSPSVLTRREREVAVLLGRGLTNRQIAEDLVITETTAASYVKRVKQRLGLDTRGQVTAWAVEHHLDEPHRP
jgi:predicted ATPase/DNA-binding CsgD family transcriptional regulator